MFYAHSTNVVISGQSKKKKYKLKLSTVNFEEDNSFLPFGNNLIHNINMSVTFVS